MNSKNVLDKIISMLSSEKKAVEMTYAKLADGTIVESATFDVGETLEVVSEDGTKTAAPDGEHELALKDSEGKDVLIKVETEGGVITERENVELQSEEEEEVIKEEAIEEMVAGLIDTLTPDEVSSEVAEDIAEKVLEALEDKIEILKKRKSTKMESEEVEPLTEDTDKSSEEVDMKSMVEKLQYRIEELEKKMTEMMDVKEVSEGEKAEELPVEKISEMSLPKLDGAPIEEAPIERTNKFGKKVQNSQSAFLSKLYK
jgi:hypothetical protein